MAAVNLDTFSAQLEQVRPILGRLLEESDETVNAVMKGNKNIITNISRYLYRIPLQLYRGGTFAKYSAAGGSLPRGTGMKITSLQAGYIYSILMFEVLDEQVDLSKNSKQSVVDVMANTIADAMKEAKVYDNIYFFQDGTGALTANSSSAPSSTQLTFAAAGDYIGVRRLRAGMMVDIWSDTGAGATLRSGGPYKIDSVDPVNRIVTFTTAPTGMTAGDLLVVANVDDYGPAYPTSFNSGWPATGALTTEAGLTNDSFRHGLAYAHDPTTSNYYLGKQKSSIPQLQAVSINAGGTESLVPAHGQLIKDMICQSRDEKVLNGMICIFPFAQRAHLAEVSTTIANRLVQGDQIGKIIDMQPTNMGYGETFMFCDMPSIVSKRQAANRVDLVNKNNWGRAEVFPLRWYSKPGHGNVFIGRDANGQIAAYSQFGIQAAYDFVCFDPGAEGFIYNLAVPSGYV